MSTEKDPTIVDEAEELELTDKLEEGGEEEAGKPKDEADGDADQEGEGDGDEEGEGEKGQRRGKPAHKRIGELVAKGHEKDRRIAELEAQLAGKGSDAKPAPEALADLKEPNPADYELGEQDPAYLRAAAVYDVKKELAEERAKEAADQQRTEFTETMGGLDSSWQDKAEKAAEKYPDFEEVVLESAAAGEWKCGAVLSIAISESEVGADVAYHLAKNPDLAERIDKMHPIQQAMEFGRLEARFLSDKGDDGGEPKPKAKIATDAPAPPKHTTRGGGGKFSVDDDTEDFAAFEAKIMKGK